MPRESSAAGTAAFRQPLVIGHRGAPGYRPEHTAASYRLAFSQGVDAVEPDIVASRDGVLVVRHENEISGTTDVAAHPEFASRRTTKTVDGVKLTGWFTEDFTWAELQTLRCRERLPRIRAANTRFDGTEPILSLSEVLALIDDEERATGRRVSIVIEVKHAQYFLEAGYDLGALLLATLAESGWSDRREQLIIESFELGVLDRLRRSGAQGRLVFLMESAGAPADEVALLGRSARSWEWYRSEPGLDALVGRVDGISVAKKDLLSRGSNASSASASTLVDRAHARGLTVYTWTLRPENAYLSPEFRGAGGRGGLGDWRSEWAQIVRTGVDGIFVDHPDLVERL